MKPVLTVFLCLFFLYGNCQSITLKEVFKLTQSPDSVSLHTYLTEQGFFYIKSYTSPTLHTTVYANDKNINTDHIDPSSFVVSIKREGKIITMECLFDEKSQYDDLVRELYDFGFLPNTKPDPEKAFEALIFSYGNNASFQVVVARKKREIGADIHTWYTVVFAREFK